MRTLIHLLLLSLLLSLTASCDHPFWLYAIDPPPPDPEALVGGCDPCGEIITSDGEWIKAYVHYTATPDSVRFYRNKVWPYTPVHPDELWADYTIYHQGDEMSIIVEGLTYDPYANNHIWTRGGDGAFHQLGFSRGSAVLYGSATYEEYETFIVKHPRQRYAGMLGAAFDSLQIDRLIELTIEMGEDSCRAGGITMYLTGLPVAPCRIAQAYDAGWNYVQQ